MSLHKYYKTLELDKILKQLADEAVCEQGKQLAIDLIPSNEESYVNQIIAQTNDAYVLLYKYDSPKFYTIKNCDTDLKRANAGSVLTNRIFLEIAKILIETRLLLEYKTQAAEKLGSCEYFFDSLLGLKEIEKRISDVIINEDEIDDNASPLLYKIRKDIITTELKARESLEKIVKSPKYQTVLQDNVITMRDGRFVIPVKVEHKNEIQGLVHDSSASGATLFIEPISVVEANNKIRLLQAEEKKEIERILAELSVLVGEQQEIISQNYINCVYLDFIFAKAKLAKKMNANVPIISKNSRINLIKARHPLIDPKIVVPIDIEINNQNNCIVITGPNTGGKTVTLKTVGLITLMAMCGLMLPTSQNSEICIFENVLVDIGDEQSIEQSLSTFSAHIKNIISIVNNATPDSLILLDELGSGTDPVEGSAIAIAILDTLREFKAKILATTHYSELKIYALQTNGVQNASCEFDVESLKPTYRLLVGIPGKSNAFAISKKLGLSERILQKADEFISKENKTFENVVDNLEKSRQNYEKLVEKNRLENDEILAIKQKMEQENETIEKNLQSELEKARLQATKIIEDAKSEADKILDELDEVRKQKDQDEFKNNLLKAKVDIKTRFNSLDKKLNPINTKTNANYKLPRKLKVGDEVQIVDIDKKGTVISLPDNNSNVLVQTGILKTRVKLQNLRLIENQQQIKVNGIITKNVVSNKERTVARELDLRGKQVEEALLEIDMFIDNCIMGGINLINIIHGKGTGVLRSAVHKHLKNNKAVKSFRLGVYGEGESGVTIAQLK